MSFALSVLEYRVETIEIFVSDAHITIIGLVGIIITPALRIILEHCYKMKIMRLRRMESQVKFAM